MKKKNKSKIKDFVKSKKFVLIIIILFSVLLRLYFNPLDIDDAPITYRYAENIAEGKGFVYNEGERVLGTTTPLFTLILAGFIKLGFDVFFISNLIGLISAVVSIILVYLILKDIGKPNVGLIAAALLAIINDFVIYTMNGMETSFYIMLIFASFYFYIKRNINMIITGFLIGLSVLTRPDGFILAFVVYGHYFIRKWKIPWKSGFTFLGTILPWFIFSKLYFGSFLPASLIGKQIQGAVAQIPFITRLFGFFFDRSYLILIPFMILGLFYVYKIKKLYVPTLWASVYVLAYIVVGVEAYAWYFIPLIPVFVIVASLGIERISELIKKNRKIVSYVFVIGIIAVILPTSILGMHHYHQKVDRNWENYIKVSLWLKENIPENSSLMFGAIGYVGYYGRQKIIDTAFLVTEIPDSIRNLEDKDMFKSREYYSFVYEHFKPDYVIFRYKPMVDDYKVVPEWMKENYNQIKNFTFTNRYTTEDLRFSVDYTDIWLIYKRK